MSSCKKSCKKTPQSSVSWEDNFISPLRAPKNSYYEKILFGKLSLTQEQKAILSHYAHNFGSEFSKPFAEAARKILEEKLKK